MLSCAGYSAYYSWVAHYDAPGAMSVAAQTAVLDQHGVSFLGWLLLHVGSVGTNGRQQLFYLAFAGQYHGLTRAGIDVFSRYGFSVSLDMFDRWKKMCIEQTSVSIRYLRHFWLCDVCRRLLESF